MEHVAGKKAVVSHDAFSAGDRTEALRQTMNRGELLRKIMGTKVSRANGSHGYKHWNIRRGPGPPAKIQVSVIQVLRFHRRDGVMGGGDDFVLGYPPAHFRPHQGLGPPLRSGGPGSGDLALHHSPAGKSAGAAASGITSVGEGRFEPIQVSSTGDEIEYLGESFNRMIRDAGGVAGGDPAEPGASRGAHPPAH